MPDESSDRTASLMTPARLAQLKVRTSAPPGPAAWLDQLAADAGSGHVRRLADLRGQLEAQARDRSYRAVQATLEALAGALQQVDFALLQPKGWLARATGKGKEAGAGFRAQVDRVLRAAEEVKEEAQALQRKQQAQGGATDRTLLEFDVEVKAIEKIIDQGARWLQDMRNQLKEREAKAAGQPAALQRMQQDAARCELLVARLKLLRAAASAAQQAGERCKATATRRATLVESLQQALAGEWTTWQQRLAPIADEAADKGAATEGVDRARTVHQELLACAKQVAQDCTQLQAQERALADELVTLQAPLQAAG
jgi:hypothetical protein